MSEHLPFRLGHRVFTFLLDFFLFNDFSVNQFSRGLQVTFFLKFLSCRALSFILRKWYSPIPHYSHTLRCIYCKPGYISDAFKGCRISRRWKPSRRIHVSRPYQYNVVEHHILRIVKLIKSLYSYNADLRGSTFQTYSFSTSTKNWTFCYILLVRRALVKYSLFHKHSFNKC